MMDANELTCKELVELVTEYLEETLPPAERARFDAHLAICPGCHAYLAQMQQTVALLHGLTEETIPPETLRAFIQTFRDWKTG